MSRFGAELRRIRVAAGLSQERLALDAGITAKTLRSIENATGSRPRASTLGQLFDALGISGRERQRLLSLVDEARGSATALPVSEQPTDATDGRFAEPLLDQPDLASLLRRLRTSRSWTQRALADRAGVHRRTISNLERGVATSAHPGTAMRLANALALSGNELDAFVAVAAGTDTVVLDRGPDQLHGRVEELRSLRTQLAQQRVVAIVGSGGVGKTALALAATNLVAQPTTVLRLAGQPSGVPLQTAMAEQLGVDSDEISAIATAVDAWQLVVIDNVEHLTHVGETLSVLLDALADTRFVVTSRSPISLASGEIGLVRLEPLDPTAAVTLLRQRIAEIGGTAAWDDTAPYEEVCDAVDHLPLAIELVAAWTPIISPVDLIGQLHAPLSILSRRGDHNDRHDSIRTVVEWTLGLLPDRAIDLFTELAVHPTPFTLALAERAHREIVDVLAGLGELVDAGLLTVVGHESPTRFQMLRVVREVAAERLGGDPSRQMRLAERRAAWASELVGEADEGLIGDDQASWLHRLDLEREHLNLAVEDFIDADSAIAVDLAGGMWRYWQLRGLYERGCDRISRALAVTDADTAGGYGTALYGRSVLRFLAGQVSDAVTDAHAAMEIYSSRDDGHGVGSTYSLLGMIEQYSGDVASSEGWYRRGLETTARQNPRAYATLQTNLGSLYGNTGRLTEAIDLTEEAVARFADLGDMRSVADGTGNMALWEIASGAPRAARDSLATVLTIFDRLSDPQGEANARLGLAEVALLLGDLDEARTELTAAEEIVENIRDPWGTSVAAAHRAMIELLSSRRDNALRLARQARLAADELGYEHAQVRANAVTAVCRAEQGRSAKAIEAARRGLAAASANPVMIGILTVLVSAVTEDEEPSISSMVTDALTLVDGVADAPLVERVRRVAAIRFPVAHADAHTVDAESLRQRAIALTDRSR